MEERRRLILERLKTDGRVAVADLSDRLRVSNVTIRQDLRALEADGLLERTHGGAVEVRSRRNEGEPELSFDVRRNKQIGEKDALGKAASEMIETGSAIALDASTTVCSILQYVSHLDSLTVVTNNLIVPELSLKYPQFEVLFPAGKLRRDSFSIIGDPASLPDINLNIGFFSAWGISLEAGLTEASEEEMVMKKTLLTRSLTKVLLVDSLKWGQVAPYTYARPEDFDVVLTTDAVPQSKLQHFSLNNLQVIAI